MDQKDQTITDCYPPYHVTHTFTNDGTSGTHTVTTGRSMLGFQQRNRGIHDVRTDTLSPTICKKMGPVLCQTNGTTLIGGREK